MGTDNHWYIISGDINLDNFTKLQIDNRSFIWRGFTHEYEMKPSAANYGQHDEPFVSDRSENCYPFWEIKRIAEKIYELNRQQKFPFEIPLSIRNILFPSFYKIEDRIFDALKGQSFPDYSLAQTMSIVQHEYCETSLLDFSTNINKALYFAIGKEQNLSKPSKIFGLYVPYLETHKNNLADGTLHDNEIYARSVEGFDLFYPSYFMNDKIAHQEGVFLYQKFRITNPDSIKKNEKYVNIIDCFKEQTAQGIECGVYKKVTIDEFLSIADEEKYSRIIYVLLDVPAKEKVLLKMYLHSIGITDDYMTPKTTVK
jgi:hypothetical protein